MLFQQINAVIPRFGSLETDGRRTEVVFELDVRGSG
jgi:hypothetical protein